MKKILATLALVAAFGLALMPAQADRPYVETQTDPVPGYGAVVCSVWNNDSDPNGAYTSMNPGTGKYFHLVQVYGNAASEAQSFTIRFWETTTDSTSIYSGAITVDVASGAGGLLAEFPVQCAWLSFTGVATTDDITVMGYLKTTTGPTVVAD